MHKVQHPVKKKKPPSSQKHPHSSTSTTNTRPHRRPSCVIKPHRNISTSKPTSHQNVPQTSVYITKPLFKVSDGATSTGKPSKLRTVRPSLSIFTDDWNSNPASMTLSQHISPTQRLFNNTTTLPMLGSGKKMANKPPFVSRFLPKHPHLSHHQQPYHLSFLPITTIVQSTYTNPSSPDYKFVNISHASLTDSSSLPTTPKLLRRGTRAQSLFTKTHPKRHNMAMPSTAGKTTTKNLHDLATIHRHRAAKGEAPVTELKFPTALRVVLKHVWERGQIKVQFKVLIAMLCLVLGKACTIILPLLFRDTIDKVIQSSPQMQGVPGDSTNNNDSPLEQHLPTETFTDWIQHVITEASFINETDWKALPIAILVAYGTLRIGSVCFSEIRNVLFGTVVAKSIESVSTALITRLLTLDRAFHVARDTPALCKSVDRGINALRVCLSVLAFEFIPSIIEIGLTVSLMALTFGTDHAAIVATTILLYGWYTMRIIKWRGKFRRLSNSLDNQISRLEDDALINWRTAQSLNNIYFLQHLYHNAVKRLTDVYLLTLLSNTALRIGQVSIFSIGITISLIYSLLAVESHDFTVGEFVGLHSFLLNTISQVRAASTAYGTLKASVLDLQPLLSLEQLHSEIFTPKNPIKMLVRHPNRKPHPPSLPPLPLQSLYHIRRGGVDVVYDYSDMPAFYRPIPDSFDPVTGYPVVSGDLYHVEDLHGAQPEEFITVPTRSNPTINGSEAKGISDHNNDSSDQGAPKSTMSETSTTDHKPLNGGTDHQFDITSYNNPNEHNPLTINRNDFQNVMAQQQATSAKKQFVPKSRLGKQISTKFQSSLKRHMIVYHDCHYESIPYYFTDRKEVEEMNLKNRFKNPIRFSFSQQDEYLPTFLPVRNSNEPGYNNNNNNNSNGDTNGNIHIPHPDQNQSDFFREAPNHTFHPSPPKYSNLPLTPDEGGIYQEELLKTSLKYPSLFHPIDLNQSTLSDQQHHHHHHHHHHHKDHRHRSHTGVKHHAYDHDSTAHHLGDHKTQHNLRTKLVTNKTKRANGESSSSSNTHPPLSLVDDKDKGFVPPIADSDDSKMAQPLTFKNDNTSVGGSPDLVLKFTPATNQPNQPTTIPATTTTSSSTDLTTQPIQTAITTVQPSTSALTVVPLKQSTGEKLRNFADSASDTLQGFMRPKVYHHAPHLLDTQSLDPLEVGIQGLELDTAVPLRTVSTRNPYQDLQNYNDTDDEIELELRQRKKARQFNKLTRTTNNRGKNNQTISPTSITSQTQQSAHDSPNSTTTSSTILHPDGEPTHSGVNHPDVKKNNGIPKMTIHLTTNEPSPSAGSEPHKPSSVAIVREPPSLMHIPDTSAAAAAAAAATTTTTTTTTPISESKPPSQHQQHQKPQQQSQQHHQHDVNHQELGPEDIRQLVSGQCLNQVQSANLDKGSFIDITDGVSYEFHNVTLFQAHTNLTLLDNVSLTIPKNKTTAIVGAHRSGKSQILNLLARELDPTDGHISCNNVNLSTIRLADLHGMTGKVVGETFLFNISAFDNVLLANRYASNREVIDAMTMARLPKALIPDSAILQSHPRQPGELALLPQTVGEKGGVYLNPQAKSRVAMARILLKSPKVVLCDEIDTNTIKSALQHHLDRKTLVMVTHDLKETTHADVIHVLNHGQLVETGTHEELLAKGLGDETKGGGFYAKLWHEQMMGGGYEAPLHGDYGHALH